jgi:hypothetical protein
LLGDLAALFELAADADRLLPGKPAMAVILILLLADIPLVYHACKTGRARPWAFIILAVPLVGSLAYICVELVPDWFSSPGARQARQRSPTGSIRTSAIANCRIGLPTAIRLRSEPHLPMNVSSSRVSTRPSAITTTF